MEWLRILSDFAETGQRRFEERLPEIQDLPRGKYLRRKRELLNEPEVAFYRSTSPPASVRAVEELGPVPGELRQLLEWSDGVGALKAAPEVVEIQIFGVQGIQQFKAMARHLVDRDELFPPVFGKLLIFGSDFARRHLAIWTGDAVTPAPVLLVDLEDREILVVSHSLDLFFQRIAFALIHGIRFRVGTRSTQLRDFIKDSEPGLTYPPKVKGQTQFSFDRVSCFPESWRSLLSENDLSFRPD
ncbi:MAG: hypothetical protein QNI99_10860 [Woeseiaceae bacterium]|nr:hypothetical protein [Woeseiaceae bacterium]